MRKIIVAAALVAAAFANAGAPSLTVCSGSDALLKDIKVYSPDADWVAGTTVTITVEGTLSEAITGGTIATKATFDGMSAVDKTENLCTYDGSPFACPLAAGAQKWTFPFAIPTVPWSGTLLGTSTLTTTDGKPFYCMNMQVAL
jgi:hypothetical protein